MRELAAILKGWRAHPGEPMVLATVVETTGSTYRHAGARMLITNRGWIAGSVSGGCLESDLTDSAWNRTEHGPTMVTYDAASESDIVWGFGLGCNGVATILLERLEANDANLALMEACVTAHEPFRIATSISEGPNFGHRSVARTSALSNSLRVVEFEGDRVLIEEIVPPPRLLIFGSGHDVLPLIRFASLLGWRTAVASRGSNPDRFAEADEVLTDAASVVASNVDARTFVVVMTHNYLRDLEILEGLLQSLTPYIGLLGPAARRARLLRDIGVSEEMERIHGPVGLDLGAEGPEEIALAIVAEIQAVLARRAAGFLSRKPILSEAQSCAHLV